MASYERILPGGESEFVRPGHSGREKHLKEIEAAERELEQETEALLAVPQQTETAPQKTERAIDDQYEAEVRADIDTWEKFSSWAKSEVPLWAVAGATAYAADSRAGVAVGVVGVARSIFQTVQFLNEHKKHLQKEDQLKLERLKLRARKEAGLLH